MGTQQGAPSAGTDPTRDLETPQVVGAGGDGSTGDRHESRGNGPFRRPPGIVFHLALALPTLAFLWSVSFPAFDFLFGVAAFGAIMIGAIIWFVRAGIYVFDRSRRDASGSPAWFLVAPIAGVLVIALVFTSSPLRARWALSRGEFTEAMSLAPPATGSDDWVSFEVPDRLGSYRITQAHRVGDAFIFLEEQGVLFGFAGFAFLPNGRFDELSALPWESPQFRPLGGGWYAWTASWRD